MRVPLRLRIALRSSTVIIITITIAIIIIINIMCTLIITSTIDLTIPITVTTTIQLPCGTGRRPSEPISLCNSAKAFAWRLAHRLALAPIGARGLIPSRINDLIPNRLSYPETLGVGEWVYQCMSMSVWVYKCMSVWVYECMSV